MMTRHRDNSTPNSSYAVHIVRQEFPYLNERAITHRLKHASFVSLEHKLLYVDTPKAACSTMKHFLRELCGAKPIIYSAGARESRRDMLVHARSNVPLPSLVDLDEQTQHEVLSSPTFLRFCIVRNPYSRIVSAWRNKVAPCEPGYEYVYEAMTGSIPPLTRKKILDFETFLRFVEREPDLETCDPHWRKQIALTYYPAIPYTHIGRLERLTETMEVIGRHIYPVKLPRLGNSNTTSLSSDDGNMTEIMAETVFNLYAVDFCAFGYSKDSWRCGIGAQSGYGPLSDPRFFDEIVERNLMISSLYRECSRLETLHQSTYRLSLKRIFDVLTWAWSVVAREDIRRNRRPPAHTDLPR